MELEGKKTTLATSVEGTDASSSQAISSNDASKTEASALNPLETLGSMWTGLFGVASSASKPTTESRSAGRGQPSEAPALAAPQWLSDAGKLLETTVRDVGDKLKSVDSSVLEEQMTTLRDRSGKLMEDVSKSVQEMNIPFDQNELQKGAANIQTSTKNLFDMASKQLQQGTKEALEIFVDAPAAGSQSNGAAKVTRAPWDLDALPDVDQKYADALREQMLKIVVDAIYSKKRRIELFLSNAAEKASFQFDFEANSDMARAALEADNNMRRLRAGLVPAKMREEDFWNTYFYHVDRVRKTLRANNGIMPEDDPVDHDYIADGIFADDHDDDEELAAVNASPAPGDKATGNGKAEDGKIKVEARDKATDGRDWEEEIDAIFDDETDA